MADDSVKQLVANLTLNIDGWEGAVKEAKSILASSDEDDKARISSSKAATQEAIDGIKQQVAAQQLLKEQSEASTAAEKAKAEAIRTQAAATKASAEASIAAASQTAAAEKAKLAATEAAAAATKAANDQALADARLQAAASAKASADKIAHLRAEQALIQKEIADTSLLIKKKQEEAAVEREKLAAERHEGSRGEEGGGLTQFLKGPATILGGGKGSLGGSLVGGLLGGFAGTAIFETLSEGLTKLTEKIKEFVEDSGGLQKVLETFQKLNEMKYGDSGIEFLEQLKDKTHNLVAETDLLRNANTFMGSALKVSKEQMLALTEATVGLARGQGHDATQAVQGLTRMFLTGGRGAMQLARIIGVQLPRSAAAGLGPLATQTQKAQAQFDALSKQILSTFSSLGAPVLTFTDRLTQVKTVTNELFEALAQGAVKSAGFNSLISLMGSIVDKMGGMEGTAEKIGEAIGNVFGGVSAAISAFLPVLSDLGKLFVQIATYAGNFGAEVISVGDSTDGAKSKFAELHPVLDSISSLFFECAKNVDKFVNSISDMIDQLPRAAEVGKKFIAPYKAIGDYILDDVLQVDRSKFRSDQASPTSSDLDATRLRTEEGKELAPTDSPKAAQWRDETKRNVERIQSESARKSARISDLLHAGKLSPSDAQAQLAGISQQAKETIITAKQENAESVGLKYKPTNEDIDTQYAQKKRQFQESVQGGEGLGTTGKPLQTPEDLAAERREAIAEAKAQLDAQKKLADENFAAAKQHIEIEKDANEELYKEGSSDATTYYETKKKLDLDTFNASMKHIDEEEAAARQSLQNRLKENEISKTTFNILSKATTTEFQTKRIEAQTTLNKGTSQANIGENQERSREQIELIQTELEAKKAAIVQETEAVKTGYAEQLLSGKEYLDQSVALIQANLQATVEAESKKQATGLRPEQQEASLKAQQKAYEDAYKALETLDDHFTQEVLTNTQKRFSNIQSTLTFTQSISTTEGGKSASPSNQLINLAQQRDATDAQITALENLLGTTKAYSDTWFQIYNAILAATQQAQQLTNQMELMASISQNAGNVLSTFAKNTSNVFTSKYGAGFEHAIGAAGESLTSGPEAVKQLFGRKTPEVTDPRLQALINGTKTATDGIIESAKDSSSGLNSFTDSIKSAAAILSSALDSLADKIKEIVVPGSTLTGDLDTRNVTDAEPNTTTPTGASIESKGVNELAKTPTSITATTPAVPVVMSPSQAPISTMSPNVPSVSADSGVIPFTPSESNATGSEDENSSVMPDASSGTGGLLGNLPDTFANLTQKIQGAIGALGGFISSITSAQSASAGAFGGGVSGAGLGNAVGSQLGQSGGPLSSLGAMAGPFGALLGAGIGAALGGIMGQKQEEVQDDITQLNVTYKDIMSNYSSNNQSLQATIQQIQNLIAQAESDEASTKKGGQQFAQLITQYNEQIQQLQDQAEQTMSQMQQQLDVITSPEPFQTLLSSIQQVIQQYTQFASAAQNATDLANANQFLSTSLANIGEQYTETLQQDEVSAINDALQLNDLYTQRNQLQLQFLQSTEQIMGQGTLTRQITQSQQKFSQLYTLDVNHQNQLDLLTQQIDVEQYKVQAEQQIFNLATTKAGLEQQSLILQEQGINLDMSRISAMQQLLATLASTGYSITNLAGINTSDPNQLMQLLLSLLLGQLGISGNNVLSSTGTLINPGGPGSSTTQAELDTLVAGTYASRSQLGYAAFRGTNL